MAVVMTTKFYEEDTPAWHDLSKIVFTSPNIDSPNVAGTRSHILPGELDLGMWYEDTSNMYKIEDKQEIDISTYFGYSAQVHDQFDMDNPPLYITLDDTNQPDWIEYIRERVDKVGGSWPMKYTKVAPTITEVISYDNATYSGIAPAITLLNSQVQEGVNAADPILEGFIQFPISFFPTKVSFKNYYFIDDAGETRRYITKTFKITDDGEELFYDNTMSFSSSSPLTFSRDHFYYTDSTKYSNFHVELLEQVDDPTVSGVVMSDLEFTGYYHTSISAVTCSSGTTPENIFNGTGWCVDEVGADPHWVLLSFAEPKRVTKVIFTEFIKQGYKIKDYKIQACTTIDGEYIDLYSGRVTDHTTTITFSNYIGYKYYRFYCYSKYASSSGYGLSNCEFYEYEIDESDTNPITLYLDSNNTIDISHANNALTTDCLFKLSIDSVGGTGVVASGTSVYGWGQSGIAAGHITSTNSIVFEVTNGECYDCRLTAWDDVTHTTTLNHLLSTDRCRVSCLAYNANGTSTTPIENEGISFIHPPVLNRIFKGNVVYEGTNYYYGDFNMIYRTGSVLGDYLIFKPMLYEIDDTIPYGIHDHVIVLHYTYT